ncbi:MAG: HEAT repeat domain-containing protein [bacterium]|nr:HEAT repeat domain-containing protein [bacterium]MDD5354140.1 HEAT repeat domain-containing protein [bacterium]MDD5755949.1 HEAT repeat domain-containing protein [bacterium]
MKKKLLLAVFFFLVWLLPATVFGAAETLKLTIKPVKKRYTVFEPVQIQFMIKNSSKQPVNLNNLSWPNGARWLYALKIYDGKQNRIMPVGQYVFRKQPTSEEITVINSGEVFEHYMAVEEMYNRLGPGTYTMIGLYHNYRYNLDTDQQLWTGEITSKPVEVEIEPMATETLDVYISNLRQGDDAQQQVTAMQILSLHRDSRAISFLRNIALQETNPNNTEAVKALGLIGDAAIPALSSLLTNLDQSRWPEIIFALGMTKSTRAIPYLVPLLLVKQEENISAWALQALASIEDIQARDLIVQKLKDPRETIRQIAVEALGKGRDPRSIPVLIEMLKTEFRANVRRQIAKALYLLSGEVYPYKDYQGKITAFNPKKDLSQDEKDALHDYLARDRQVSEPEDSE